MECKFINFYKSNIIKLCFAGMFLHFESWKFKSMCFGNSVLGIFKTIMANVALFWHRMTTAKMGKRNVCVNVKTLCVFAVYWLC